MNKLTLLTVLLLIGSVGYAQKTCTSNPTTISGNINFGSITWTASGGATVTECNNMADGLITFTGNVIVDLANNVTVTITNDVTIIGNFPISGGSGSRLRVNGGYTLNVSGDLGDAANNGVAYDVFTSGDSIIVGGTLYGKNNNAFSGSGSISGGALNVKNGSNCGTPCPVSGGFSSCTAGDGFCTTYSVTPVEMLYFSATADQGGVRLNWATASEENFDRFEILRYSGSDEIALVNNIANYQSIAEVFSKGNGPGGHEYSFSDEVAIGGTNYYALKAIDLDGSFEYFGPARAEFAGEPLIVMPNPANSRNHINFKTSFIPGDNDIVTLVDNIGLVVARENVSGNVGTLSTDFEMKPGIYFLKYSGSVNKVVRVVVR